MEIYGMKFILFAMSILILACSGQSDKGDNENHPPVEVTAAHEDFESETISIEGIQIGSGFVLVMDEADRVIQRSLSVSGEDPLLHELVECKFSEEVSDEGRELLGSYCQQGFQLSPNGDLVLKSPKSLGLLFDHNSIDHGVGKFSIAIRSYTKSDDGLLFSMSLRIINLDVAIFTVTFDKKHDLNETDIDVFYSPSLDDPLAAAGFGHLNATQLLPLIDQNPSCRVVSVKPITEYSSKYVGPGFPTGCQVSSGDSGGMLIDPKSGRVTSIITSGIEVSEIKWQFNQDLLEHLIKQDVLQGAVIIPLSSVRQKIQQSKSKLNERFFNFLNRKFELYHEDYDD
jgi:hypothetical protein